MAEEVLFEVVDEEDGLVEELLGLATIHQDGFGTEHFRYFGKDGGSALCHQEVGEHAQERVGGDARETIGATALQANTKFAERNGLALVLLGLRIEFVEDAHTLAHFVLNVLGDEELDAALVVVAQEFFEHVRLVVLATQTEHEHATRIRMEHDVT